MPAGVVLTRTVSVIGGSARGNAVRAGAIVPVTFSVLSAVIARGTVFTRTASLVRGAATGSAGRTGTVLARGVLVLTGTARGNASRAGAVIPVAASVFRGRQGQAVGGVLQTGLAVSGGAALAAAGAAGGTLAVAAPVLAGAAAGDSYHTGSTLEVAATLGAGTACVPADAAGTVVEIAVSIEAGEARGDALFAPLDTPGRASLRTILAGEVSGDALFEPPDTPGRSGGRTILGGAASGVTGGTGFDGNFDYDFDGTQGVEIAGQVLAVQTLLEPGTVIGAGDVEVLGQVLLVQASLRPGTTTGRHWGFIGRWYPPTQSVSLDGALFLVAVRVIPGDAIATVAVDATAAGAVVGVPVELVAGRARGQIVSLNAGRASGDATVAGATVGTGITVITDLQIMRDNVFLLTCDEVNPVVCDNDLLMRRAA